MAIIIDIIIDILMILYIYSLLYTLTSCKIQIISKILKENYY